MVRSLLTERFKLQRHNETREGAIYAVDQTGLTGTYDVNLEWSVPVQQPLPAAQNTSSGLQQPDDGLSLFTALEEQLGLKLQSTKGPVDVIVIDHVEKPTPD